MAEVLAQVPGRLGVALAGLRVHLGGRAADGALEDPQPRAPELDLLPNQPELRPGQAARDIDIGAEAERVEAPAGRLLQRLQAGQADDRDGLGRHIGEVMPGRLGKARGAAGLLAQEAAEEGGDLCPAGRGPGIGQQGRPLRRADQQLAGPRIEGAVQQGEPGIGHEAAEMPLLQPGRGGGIEGRVALGQGEAAIMRQAFALPQRDLLQGFRRQALHRVTVDVFDAHRN